MYSLQAFLQPLGKYLMLAGLVLMGLGTVFFLFPNIPFLGKLPGDIRIEKPNFCFYFPITTCILVTLVLSLLLKLLRKGVG
ncbi:MAG: DUF2905 domain-containing protein [Elusimicrobia bacterium]|nr:DUF2905 domain-containing protein [Elusimicrobiota bacterium]